MNWQWLAMLGVAVVAVVAALLFRRYVGFVARTHARSMWPTLHPGQFLFARSIRHRWQIRHGDIALVQSPELGQCIVKRVAGLPGDRLTIGSDGLVRNGMQVAEPYVSRAGGKRGSWLVPEDHCFLLGDNRAASSDSRSWKQSFVPLDRIVGRVLLRCAGASRTLDGTMLYRSGASDLRGGRRDVHRPLVQRHRNPPYSGSVYRASTSSLMRARVCGGARSCRRSTRSASSAR
jgi:signal peptidase I